MTLTLSDLEPGMKIRAIEDDHPMHDHSPCWHKGDEFMVVERNHTLAIQCRNYAKDDWHYLYSTKGLEAVK